jgi:hypothetical protein
VGAAVFGITLSQTEPLVFPSENAGYKPLEARDVTITNTGNAETGELTLKVSNAVPSGGFRLDKETIASIAAGKKAAFTVKPNTGLEAGIYTAKVTVSGGNGISAAFNVRFTVTEADEPDEPEEPVDPPEEPVYGIELDAEGDYTFPDAVEGYGTQEPLAVTITNIGKKATGKLTIAVSNADFTLSKSKIDNIAVDGEDSFTVVPAGGLGKGTYTATVTVSGENIEERSFEVNFAVNIAPVYGIELSEKGTLVFDDAIFGYKPLVARDVTVANSGNQPTGVLAVALTGANPSAFTLDPQTTITDIAAGSSGSFTVVPALGLSVGTHTATVSVTGGNGISASFDVRFTVKPVPAHGIALSSDGTAIGASYTHQFGTGTLPNYTLPAALSVTVANSGNQPTGVLAIGLTGTGSGSFTLDKQTITSIAAGSSGSFTVVPKTDLSAGTHTATITVSGDKIEARSFDVSFVVRQTFASIITRMNEDKNLASASYTMSDGAEALTDALTLTTANSPASVTIDGGGSVITGSVNSITGSLNRITSRRA